MESTLRKAILEDDDEDLFLILLLFCSDIRSDVKDIFKNRNSEGSYEILIKRYLMDDETLFVTYFRLSKNLFYKVVNLIKDDISLPRRFGGSKQKILSAEQKLCITLRFLITGDTQTSMQFDSRISQPCISGAIKQVCGALKKNMIKLMPVPEENDWKKYATDFSQKWNFPHVIGAIDGKHVRIQCPPNSGSLYYNYKGFFSVVLLALVDADYKYIAIDVGAYGRESDAGEYREITVKTVDWS